MKNKECVVTAILISMSMLIMMNVKAYGGDLVLEVSGPKQPVLLSRPVPIKLVIRNEGDNTISTHSLLKVFRTRNIEMKGSANWKVIAEENQPPINLMGELAVEKLTPGKSISVEIYLNDYFEELKPGVSDFTVKLTIWPIVEEGHEKNEIVLTGEIKVNLIKDDDEKLE